MKPPVHKTHIKEDILKPPVNKTYFEATSKQDRHQGHFEASDTQAFTGKGKCMFD